MRIGKLNKRIELQSRSSSADSFGQPSNTWTTYKKTWAEVMPLAGNKIMFSTRETSYAAQYQQDITHQVRIRYNSSVTVDDRVYYDSRILEIVSVVNVGERDREMLLICREVT